MNEFVNYLNSTNNVGGNSTGSLAESQVKSSFYDSIKVIPLIDMAILV